MRIGILTHPIGTNYGGILQNYALQVILKELGHQPVTYYYSVEEPTKIKILSFAKRLLLRLMGKHIPLRGWPNRREFSIITEHTFRFIQAHINTTSKINLNNTNYVKEVPVEAVIVGSDQVWRGKRTDVKKFFLCDYQGLCIRKIAYAASFGVDYWEYSHDDTKKCSELIKQFYSVSVREQSGVLLCERYLGKRAQFVLDPTMLLSSTYYDKLIPQIIKDNNTSKSYIMTYILDFTAEKGRIIDYVCKKNGKESRTVMADKYYGEEGMNSITQCVFPPVEKWLQGFRDADFVVTDSFHGMVFSIIFRKKFIAVANEKRGSSRFTSLLNLLGLDNRLVGSISDVEKIIALPIDYKKVEKILEEKKEESIQFLKNSLS